MNPNLESELKQVIIITIEKHEQVTLLKEHFRNAYNDLLTHLFNQVVHNWYHGDGRYVFNNQSLIYRIELMMTTLMEQPTFQRYNLSSPDCERFGDMLAAIKAKEPKVQKEVLANDPVIINNMALIDFILKMSFNTIGRKVYA